jgi:hypothetical protein
MNQPPNPRRNPTKDDTGPNRRRQSLDHGCQGSDLGKIHSQTLTRPDSRMVRQMHRAYNASDSNQRRDT